MRARARSLQNVYIFTKCFKGVFTKCFKGVFTKCFTCVFTKCFTCVFTKCFKCVFTKCFTCVFTKCFTGVFTKCFKGVFTKCFLSVLKAYARRFCARFYAILRAAGADNFYDFTILTIFPRARARVRTRGVRTRTRTRMSAGWPLRARDTTMHLHTHLVRLLFRPPQQACALMGKKRNVFKHNKAQFLSNRVGTKFVIFLGWLIQRAPRGRGARWA